MIMNPSMDNLNSDFLTLEILSRLPIDSLLPCTRVCKTWRTFIRHPCFAHIHHRRQLQLLYGGGVVGMGLLFWIGHEKSDIIQLHYGSNIDDDCDNAQQQILPSKLITRIGHYETDMYRYTNTVVGSCNGLICLSVQHHEAEDPICIYNPITQEYVNLPRLRDNLFEGCMASIASGFGYHPSINQYKVVRVAYHPECSMGIVEIYTLGSGGRWRNIGEIPHMLDCSYPGVAINGALHWMDYNDPSKIVAFDLADEVFRVLPSPPCVHSDEFIDLFDILRRYKLRELGGCLCIVHWDKQGENMDIWSFKKKKKKTSSDYDMKELQDDDYYHSWSWNREIRVAQRGLHMDECKPITFTESGEILLRSRINMLSLYDPKSATMKNLVDDDKGLIFFEAIPHVNSFVSLKSLGENAVTIRKSKRVMQRALPGEISRSKINKEESRGVVQRALGKRYRTMTKDAQKNYAKI